MNIFNYYNYRKYLKDFYDHHKKTNPGFSHRQFARKAGYSSSGLYLDLVNERKNLTAQLIPKFSAALELSPAEIKYFELMTAFTHAQNAKDKQTIFESMLPLLPQDTQKLSRDQKEYFSQWYFVAVREALTILNIDTNFADLARFLTPRISVPQAKQAIALLKRLGLISKLNGFWKPCAPTIASGPEVNAIYVRNFQKQMIDLSKQALDNFTKEQRNISGTTMSVSATGLERIIRKIDEFRREVVEIARSDEGESIVAQLNVQFFPLSQETDHE